MNGFLQELGKKLAERWVALLALPGLLWAGTAIAAYHVGRSSPFSLSAVIGSPPPSAGEIVAGVVGLLIVSVGAGLTAAALGMLTQRLWTLRGRWWPARLLTRRRHRRWTSRDAAADNLVESAIRATPPGEEVVVPGLADAYSRRDRIALEPPERPTWIGDRGHALTLRVHRAHGLDVAAVWPRLWSVLPDSCRADVQAAQSAYASAATLTGWAVLYAALVPLWWPVVVIAAATLLTSHVQGRAAMRTLCDLVEAATDLHVRSLAEQLGVEPATGEQIALRLRAHDRPNDQHSGSPRQARSCPHLTFR
jgi:hypothetical protein